MNAHDELTRIITQYLRQRYPDNIINNNVEYWRGRRILGELDIIMHSFDMPPHLSYYEVKSINNGSCKEKAKRQIQRYLMFNHLKTRHNPLSFAGWYCHPESGIVCLEPIVHINCSGLEKQVLTVYDTCKKETKEE